MKLNEHQYFLRKFARPDIHFSYDEAPIAYLQHQESVLTPEIQKHASESWDSNVSSALASTTVALSPATIDKLFQNPTIRNTAMSILLGNKGMTSGNLRTAWKEFSKPSVVYSADDNTKIYNVNKLISHPLASRDIIEAALTHENPNVRNRAEYEARKRKY